MKLAIVDSLDEDAWRAFVNRHPDGNIFHTPEMFQVFKQARGHRPLLMGAVDQAGEVLALLMPVQVTLLNGLVRRLTTRSILYGGVLCAANPAGKTALAHLLHTYTKSFGREALYTEMRNLSDTSEIQPVLTQNGFTFEEHLNYVIHLDSSPGEVLQHIGARTRKHIRKALRKGTVCVEQVSDPELLPVWYRLLSKSYTAARVPLADLSLFEAAFQILQPLGMAQFWLARIESTYVAASVELLYKDVIYGWYSGVDRSYKQETPGELLMWEVLEQGCKAGYKTYDFGGAGRPDEKYGVREFKAKFGGDLVSYGRNTIVHSPFLLNLSMLGYQVLNGKLSLINKLPRPAK